MFIRSSDKQDLLPFQAEITGINIGRDVYACQVTDVYRAIGIRQSGCDQGSLEIAHSLGYLLSSLQSERKDKKTGSFNEKETKLSWGYCPTTFSLPELAGTV
jgi:hypothetical protein